MTSFLLALQFLTKFPIKIKSVDDKKIADSLIYFPVAGLFIGLAMTGINCLLGFLNFPRLAADTILVVSLIAITGGIHLDGLADTSDALLSVRSKDEMLKIMRDPRAGTMGVLSLICIILLKITLLLSINISVKANILVLMCVLSRWSMVFSTCTFAYARQEGKAKIYMQGANRKIFFLATLITLLIVFFSFYFKGILIWAIAAGTTYLINRFIAKKIDGLTGDTIGAVSEINETLTLFCALLI